MTNERYFFIQICGFVALGYGVMAVAGYAGGPSQYAPNGWKVAAGISGIAALFAAGLYLTSEEEERVAPQHA